MGDKILSQYVIYDHPRDYPEHFVVRRWDVVSGMPEPVPCGEAVLADSLEDARNAVPPGFNNIGRFANDDPVILEVWT
jgi:hypothetical protein